METLTKDILKTLKNDHTQIELKEEFKGNYYSYIIDTIYIAKNLEKKKTPKSAKDTNKKLAQLVTICHECIHSIQSRVMHILNVIFSNLSIVLTIINMVLCIFWTSPLWLKIFASVIITTSIIIRVVLEIGAIKGSIKLASDIVEKSIVDGITKEDIQKGTDYIEEHKYVAILQMVIDKIIFLILVLVIK